MGPSTHCLKLYDSLLGRLGLGGWGWKMWVCLEEQGILIPRL